MNSYELEIVDALSRIGLTTAVVLEPDSSALFSLLSRNFRSLGSKIDWERVPGSVKTQCPEGGVEETFFLQSYQSAISKFKLSGSVAYIGDSNTDFVIRSNCETMNLVLPIVFNVPQHHYLVHEQGIWCMSFTMEGEFGFGFSETSPNARS